MNDKKTISFSLEGNFLKEEKNLEFPLIYADKNCITDELHFISIIYQNVINNLFIR